MRGSSGALPAKWRQSTPELLDCMCDTDVMATELQSRRDLSTDPAAVKVEKTAGTGMEIAWKDGHVSRYTFQWLRDACPCALCDEEREQSGRKIGAPPQPKPDALPMFKAAAKPAEVSPVGRYAISFKWNDGHEHGIYSWEFLRKNCPCAECAARPTADHADSRE